MKSKSTQCPNGHGAMNRVFVKVTKEGIQKWLTLNWQYCTQCKVMLVD